MELYSPSAAHPFPQDDKTTEKSSNIIDNQGTSFLTLFDAPSQSHGQNPLLDWDCDWTKHNNMMAGTE